VKSVITIHPRKKEQLRLIINLINLNFKGVTLLLSFFVNLLVVSNYTPEAAADLPIIGVYYTFNIIQVALSVGASVCVLRFHFRGHKPNKLPILIKKILFMKNSNNVANSKLESNKRDKFVIVNRNDYNVINKKTKIHTNDMTDLLNESMLALIKLVKNVNKHLKKEKNSSKSILINNIEWKEAARRIDNLLFLISFSIVFITPVYLFSDYFSSEYKTIFGQKCSCI
jgi:hypothetical protein